MSELKNLIKTVWSASFILLSFSANAQILGIGVDFEKLNLPEQFYQSLENCTKYTYIKPAVFEDVAVSTTYSVEPMQNGSCRLSVDGTTNVSVHIAQECELTREQAKAYADALRRYQQKGYSPHWDDDKIETDADYKAAYAIMSDRKLCRFKRDKIDHTQQIRINLPSCTPAKQTELTAAITVKRQIVGKDDEDCLYTFMMQNDKISAKDKQESDKQIVFECRLNKQQTEQYVQILEAAVVPEEEGYDFSAVQRVSPAEEMNFILDYCTFKTD
ncbi:MAG: hypothetical protein IJ770_04045 [Alphaproteobacteria bacterium]|nr:hypothetical protein [Alphaproteobacteria bacterium]